MLAAVVMTTWPVTGHDVKGEADAVPAKPKAKMAREVKADIVF